MHTKNFVIPAKAGIQPKSGVCRDKTHLGLSAFSLDPDFRRDDNIFSWRLGILAFQTFLLLCTITPAVAQEETLIQQPETEITAPEPPKKREFIDEPQVRLRILDKVRAQSRTYDLQVGNTVAYANIRIRPRACRKSSPLDTPENASFLQIWEVTPKQTSEWVFSGWMFASSPSLSAMDHPVYDVTVLDCMESKTESQPETQDKTPSKEAPSATDMAIEEYISEGETNDAPLTESAPAKSE